MRFFTVDCFSDLPFAGNPNAVCLLDSGWPQDEWLQQLAAEVNLPATAFIRQVQQHPELRWFSPHSELILCGSGTLAAAHILYELGEQSATMAFATCAGQLGARREPDQRITLDFPADELRPVPVPPTIVVALGIIPQAAVCGRNDLLAELDSPHAVRRLTPDLAAVPSPYAVKVCGSHNQPGTRGTNPGRRARTTFFAGQFQPPNQHGRLA